MQALTILCVTVAMVCTSGHLVAYPGVYNYPGVFGAYPGLLSHAAPITLKAGVPGPITLKAVAPSPITLKAVAPSPIILKAVAPSPITFKSVAAAPVVYKTVATETVSPITYNVAPVSPVAAVAPVSPVAAVAPVAPFAPVHTKYHSQDELGQYSFGYAGGPSSRAETRDALGIVRGSYNYVDPEGQVQTQHYVADGLGFRVSGTNLPVAPESPETPVLAGPEPVEDTAEVAAAKATLRSLVEKTAIAPESDSTAAVEAVPETPSETPSEAVSGDATASRKKRAVVAPPAFHPYGFSYGYHAPLPYFHPATPYSAAFPGIAAYTGFPAVTTYGAAPAAVKDANLLRVVHNPGHSVSYRVD